MPSRFADTDTHNPEAGEKENYYGVPAKLLTRLNTHYTAVNIYMDEPIKSVGKYFYRTTERNPYGDNAAREATVEDFLKYKLLPNHQGESASNNSTAITAAA